MILAVRKSLIVSPFDGPVLGPAGAITRAECLIQKSQLFSHPLGLFRVRLVVILHVESAYARLPSRRAHDMIRAARGRLASRRIANTPPRCLPRASLLLAVGAVFMARKGTA